VDRFVLESPDSRAGLSPRLCFRSSVPMGRNGQVPLRREHANVGVRMSLSATCPVTLLTDEKRCRGLASLQPVLFTKLLGNQQDHLSRDASSSDQQKPSLFLVALQPLTNIYLAFICDCHRLVATDLRRMLGRRAWGMRATGKALSLFHHGRSRRSHRMPIRSAPLDLLAHSQQVTRHFW